MSSFSVIMKKLKQMSNSKVKKSMESFGINTKSAYGVSIPELRKLAKEVGKDHKLAQELWKSGVREARILASMIDEPDKVTQVQLDQWVNEFNSWDVCDQVILNLFCYVDGIWGKAIEWSNKEKEFVKRSGFATMACLAVNDKSASNKEFVAFFPFIKKQAYDERNFVKKAINWALRQIGKRNKILNKEALKLAQKITQQDSKAAQWIAKDALRELKSNAVQIRLKKKYL